MDTLFDIPTVDAPVPAPVDPGGALFAAAIKGKPAPQGSKRPMAIYAGKGTERRFTGKIYMKEQTAENLDPWRSRVTSESIQVCDGRPPLDEALLAVMVFTAARPKNHYRTGRNAHLLRDDAPARPLKKPDVSKLARAVEDALTDAGVYKDDSLIVEYLRLAKVYAGEDPDALDSPGVVIRLYPIGATP